MQQETEFKIGGTEVVVELTRRGFVKFIGRLRFYDQLVIHNQVESLHSQFIPFVHDADGYLACNAMFTEEQFPLQRHDV